MYMGHAFDPSTPHDLRYIFEKQLQYLHTQNPLKVQNKKNVKFL